MKDEIGDVVTGGVQPVELAIRGMREPRQRVPIAGVSACKSPFDRRPTQAAQDKRILIDVKLVVEVDELVFPNDKKCQNGDNCQAQSYRDAKRALGL